MDRFGSSRNRLALAGVLIAVGVVLLITQTFGYSFAMPWPLLIIVLGVVLVVFAALSDWNMPLAAAGATVASVGLILLVQSFFGYYRSWAYAWSLLPFAPGALLAYVGTKRNTPEWAERGRKMMQWSAIAFVVLALVFELVLFHGGQSWGRYLGPLALIAIGALILFRRSRHRDAEPPDKNHTD